MADDLSGYPKTKKEAKDAGSSRYFTGNPCKHGHIALRITDNGTCVACHDKRVRRWQAENNDKVNEAKRLWRKKDHVREKEREYSNEWRKLNPDKVKAMKSRDYENRKEYILEKTKEYYHNNKDWLRPIMNEYSKKWRDENPDKCREYASRRRKRIRLATPSWADSDMIERIHIHARFLTWLCNDPHEVDHIVPIAGNNVCGLNVEYNMRTVPSWVNMEKGNKLIEELL